MTAGLHDRGDGVRLAYDYLPGLGPAVVFLPGFMSDMTGDKAAAVAAWCAARGRACLRLDYSGHGASGGGFEDGTISRWTADALCLVDHLAGARFLLIGSSMGGWIALNIALARPERLTGLIGIAAAPDFTEDLMWPAFSETARSQILQTGELRIPSQYGGEQIITRALIEDGRENLRLRAPLPIQAPVRLLQGQRDPDVPWQTALRLAGHIEAEDVRLTLIKDGDHRLSRPQDIALLLQTLAALLGEDGG